MLDRLIAAVVVLAFAAGTAYALAGFLTESPRWDFFCKQNPGDSRCPAQKENHDGAPVGTARLPQPIQPAKNRAANAGAAADARHLFIKGGRYV